MGIYMILLAALAAHGIPPAISQPAPAAAVLVHKIPAQKTTTIALAPAAPPKSSTVRTAWVTAYSSTPEETDDTPFITASGTRVRDGIVATNLFPFNTRVKIPKLFGDKVFVVEDRMHERKTDYVDVWMPTKSAALRFGITRTEVVILED